ncbi:NAD(P)H-hydrate dehydratase [bacterium]|nr:NAD(P)H-hydrate dehydratase [bacterium]
MQKKIQYKLIFPEIIWERPLNIYKSALGKVFILAGSEGMGGAAALTLEASMRSGAGITVLMYPECLKSLYKKLIPEGMTVALPFTPSGSVSLQAKERILDETKAADVLVCGPGLSRNAETTQLVWELFFSVEIPLILDADALNAISLGFSIIKERGGRSHDVLSYLKSRKFPTIITPHPGEMLRIVKAIRSRGEYLKITSDYIDSHKEDIARYVAEKLDFVVVLKGHETVIADKSNIIINKTGNPGMATAGSGDVLSGIIGTFVAQNKGSILKAVSTAVYIHGLAGDYAKEELGERSILASDIIKNFPKALKHVEGETH